MKYQYPVPAIPRTARLRRMARWLSSTHLEPRWIKDVEGGRGMEAEGEDDRRERPMGGPVDMRGELASPTAVMGGILATGAAGR